MNLLIFISGWLFPLLLAMSYFPVGLSNSRGGKALTPGTPMKVAVIFSLTSLAMLMAGYYAAGLIAGLMEEFTYWIVFVMMAFIGFRIAMMGYRKKTSLLVFDIEQFSVIFPLAFALSINSLFAGVALRFLLISPALFAIILGFLVWLFSFSGLMYGNQFSEGFSRRMEIYTGLSLMVLAILYQFI